MPESDSGNTNASGVGGKQPRRHKKETLGALLFGHVIAFVFCVLFPAFVTAVAPVSWISFARHEGVVSAEARTCTLFFIPYRVQGVAPVEGLGDRFVSGTVDNRSRDRNRRGTRSEDEGFLVVHGPDNSIEVPVSPASLARVQEEAQAFLADPGESELKLFVVANWKFSLFGGGLVSLLTVLYVVGLALGFYHWLTYLAGFREEMPPTFHREEGTREAGDSSTPG